MKFIPVKEINKEAYKGKIYDLNVKNTHTYNINNIVVGNCSSGLHGVGVTCVNALADNFEVVVKRNGAIYKQTFSRGVPTSDVEQIGKTTETGTEIKYHPDKSIFKITLNPSEHVNNRLKELASLNPGIKIRYINDVDKTDTVYHFEDGITGYTMKMIEGKIKLYDNPFSFFGQYELPNGQLILCDIAFIHDDEAEPNTKIKSFANNVNTYEGGFHLQGFKNAYKDIINQYGIDKKLIKDPIEMKYLMDGMYCTISIKIPEAEFEGQTKTKLGNKEAQEAVEKIMHDFFDKEIKNKKLYDVFDSIINRASKVKEAEEAARKARSISRQTKKASKVALPGKLAECSNKNGYRELFLTEGDSAGGSAKEGRDRTYQSILPLRGKILNVNKADIGKILNSDTVKSIVASIGGGVGKTFSLDDVRYDKIIIMCFVGDTKVKLLNGTIKTFEELVEMEKKEPGRTYWVYSKDEFGNFVPGKATNPRITRYTKEIMKLTLDNGEIIKCTPDHLFLLKNGSYKEAQDLELTDSLSSMCYRYNDSEYNKGREMIYDSTDNKWKYTHHVVMESKDCQGLIHGKSIHHIDGNFLNNVPENLKRLDTVAHHKIHGHERMVAYNESEQHKETVRRLHKDGVYEHTYFGKNGYNGSQQQHDMLVEMNQREDIRQGHIEVITAYNKTEKNRESTAKLNQRDDVKRLQAQSKIVKRVACLIRKNFTSIEDIFDAKKVKLVLVSVPSKKSVEKYFDSYEHMYSMAVEYEKNELTDEEFNRLTNVEEVEAERKQNIIKTKRNQMAKVGKIVLEKGLELNAQTYEMTKKELKSRATRYENLEKYFDDEEQFKEYSNLYNHKIIGKELITLDDPIPMYDFTVENYHNFALESSCGENKSAVMAHQCDADIDGNHIRSLILTLFYYYLPGLIESGRVYSAQPPLYRIIKSDNSSVYLLDDSELREYRQKHAKDKYTLNRFKGLGEMNPEQLGETTLDPKTRTLKRINLDEAKEVADTFEVLMGKNVLPRRQFIESNSDKIDIDNL